MTVRQKKTTQDRREFEQKTIQSMVQIYCTAHHKPGGHGEMCQDCTQLVAYAAMRSAKCPFGEQKTFCSNCRVHCYEPMKREKIRAVMRYAGPRMLWTHPLLALAHARETILRKSGLWVHWSK
ncbi:MAG: nitrous oxide-stimulated promoter family protein [Lachnospiraceae bacterium]